MGRVVNKEVLARLIKTILIALCLTLFFVILEIIPLSLESTGITIPIDLLTTLEILVMVLVVIVKYVKDIYTQFIKLLGVTKEEIDEYTGEQK